MKNYFRDQNANVIQMYCIVCRKNKKPIEDCIAVFMVDNTTYCIEHFDEWVDRNKDK